MREERELEFFIKGLNSRTKIEMSKFQLNSISSILEYIKRIEEQIKIEFKQSKEIPFQENSNKSLNNNQPL